MTSLEQSYKQNISGLSKEFSTDFFCPHFKECSGCEIDKNLFLPPVYGQIKRFYQKHGCLLNLELGKIVGSRYRAKLAVRRDKIGLFIKNSHRVKEIFQCKIHHKSINESLKIIDKIKKECFLSGYSDSTGKGILRYIQLTVEKTTGKIQAVFVVTEKNDKKLKRFIDKLKNHSLFHSIWINVQSEKTNNIFGDEWILQHGPKYLLEKFNNRTKIAFHPACFLQAHLQLFEKMCLDMKNFISDKKSILELYSGVGAISFLLCDKRKFQQFHLIEENPYAKESFEKTLKYFQYPDRFNFSVRQIEDMDLDPYDVIITDPPRKGMNAKLLKSLMNKKEGLLISVSCHFDTFQKNAEKLIEAGWRIKFAKGYLFFPGTNHIETLTLFEKKSG